MIEEFGDQIFSADEVLLMVIFETDGTVTIQGTETDEQEVVSMLRQVADQFEQEGWNFGEAYEDDEG